MLNSGPAKRRACAGNPRYGTAHRMPNDQPPPVDRFVLAATADRLIYGSETTFSSDDARTILAALPRRQSPWFEFGLRGKMSGGKSSGYAAGVGNVSIKDDKDRQFEYSTANDRYTRAGQWKLAWGSAKAVQYVEIEQVMSDVTDEGRAARILYDMDGTPRQMDIRVNRSFGLGFVVFVIPGWRPWKQPL